MSRRRTSSARAAGLVEQPPEGAFAAQVDVAALPEQLEARERDAAGVVVLLGAALQIDVAVDLEDPGARAVVRERSDGRDVAVPRRRRRVMPALLDDAGEAGAGDRRVAELVLDGERLAVLRARRRREVGLRQERVDRRGEVDPCYGGEAERWPAAGGCHKRCSTARFPRSPGPAPGDFAGTCRLRAQATRRAGALGPAPRRDPSGSAGPLRGEWALPCGKRGTAGGCPNEQLLGSRGCHAGRAVRR